LRLEHLFDRFGQLIARDAALDHHFALCTLFEVMDVSARSELKSDVLKGLDKHRQQLNSYRGNPSVSEAVLDEVVGNIDRVFDELNQADTKAGTEISTSEWLMSLRSRVGIPGGTCEFDLPGYYAWQQLDATRRRTDLVQWSASFMPLAQALTVLLRMLRESGAPQKVMALGGKYQQSLPAGKSYQLMRVRLNAPLSTVPELNAHRLMVSVRLSHQDDEGKLRPDTSDTAFELTLCA
jgi:cell division protein ZapD